MPVLVPAYGRDYGTASEAEGDFRAGRDFRMVGPSGEGGGYCSIRDFKTGEIVELRFNGKRDATTVRVGQ